MTRLPATILAALLALAMASTAADYEEWISSSGSRLTAKFIELKPDGSVVLEKKGGVRVTVKRSQLDAASQKRAEELAAADRPKPGAGDDEAPPEPGLKRKKGPPLDNTKVETLASGPFAGQHAAFVGEKFTAVAGADGILRVTPKGSSERAGSVFIRPRFFFFPGGEIERRFITHIESRSKPSESARRVTFRGTVESGVEFEYSYELSDDELLLYGSCKDPRGQELPTRIHLGASFPRVRGLNAEMVEGEISAKVGDSSILVDIGEARTFPYATPVNINQIEELKTGVTKVTVRTAQFGERTVVIVAPENPKAGSLRLWNLGMSAPWEGFGVSLYRRDAMDKSKKAALQVEIH